MLKMEFIKSFRNKTLLYIFSSVILSYILGYILPVGIDKVSKLNIGDFYFSTYTVFTQFGFLLFGFVIVYFFNKDYADKTILFNFFSGNNSLKFFFIKVTVLLFEFVFSIFISNILTAFVLNFSSFHFIFSLLMFSLIVLQYILIIGTISLIFSHLLISLGVSLFYWILTIILVAVGGFFKFVAIFDASNYLYVLVEKVFSKGELIKLHDFVVVIPYILTLIVISLFVGVISNKRWLRNGLL
ncbi:ABC transporter permease [Enterococcus faecium]|uniref:ABC transporter permease n=1 Tax=Enterococcus faecium TaxID=1352 RepID=UPI001121B806|nr:ABC transporter permease [Enterococcus faecium]TNW91143.1 ABC transporter permease [Enterococcus faecium]